MDDQVELIPGKYCYYINPDQDTNEHGGYVPSIVVEGEDGHRPLLGNGPCAAPWVWGTDLKVAQQIAAERNDRIGITPQRATQIVASSMTATIRRR